MRDYYEILGITKNATEKEIKTAYRKKALEFHPDRNKAADASEKFKEVTKAYEVLSDPQKKQMYDQYGHAAFERGGMGGAGAGQGPFGGYYTNYGGQGFNVDFDFGGAGVDPFDIFEQFFGVRGGRSQRQRRSVYQVTLTFDEAMKGVEKTTVIEGKEKNIKIPAGVDNGTQIRFSDFDVQVQVKPHQYFVREGQDIYLEKTISFPQAVLGTVIEVPTIDEPVKLKVRPGTVSGTNVRLREKGAPYPNIKNRRGDQYVIIKVAVPEKISSKAKKLLQELEKEL